MYLSYLFYNNNFKVKIISKKAKITVSHLKMSSTYYSVHTEGQTKRNTILWNIQNFLSLLENEIREFRTEKLKSNNTDPCNNEFQLKMLFLGRDNDIIELYYLSKNPVFLKATLYLCLSYEKRTVNTKEYHTIQGNKWQYIATLYKRDICTNRNTYLIRDGSLPLEYEFMVNNIKVNQCHIPEAQLSSDFENLLNNGIFSDVTMVSAENYPFKVHKAVLASRSDVLKAHFEHNTTECTTNIVESSLETDILREVLIFIYTDQSPRLDDIADKLLAAAEYYHLFRLKCLCEEALHKKLTVDNAIETLQLADLHSANMLKQLTLEFIKDGQAKLIIESEGWAKVNSVELIKRMYEYMVTETYEIQ